MVFINISLKQWWCDGSCCSLPPVWHILASCWASFRILEFMHHEAVELWTCGRGSLGPSSRRWARAREQGLLHVPASSSVSCHSYQLPAITAWQIWDQQLSCSPVLLCQQPLPYHWFKAKQFYYQLHKNVRMYTEEALHRNYLGSFSLWTPADGWNYIVILDLICFLGSLPPQQVGLWNVKFPLLHSFSMLCV